MSSQEEWHDLWQKLERKNDPVLRKEMYDLLLVMGGCLTIKEAALKATKKLVQQN